MVRCDGVERSSPSALYILRVLYVGGADKD
jgi:hypothetical protein